jgi:hypothetical protein
MNSIPVDEVKTIYAAQAARKDVPDGFDPRQSTRVLVKARLQELNPLPYSTVTPDMQAARDRRGSLTRKELAEQHAYMRAQVTEEDHERYARARGTPDTEAVRDAHHFAQKMHGKALWELADGLVEEVLGKAVTR